MLSALLCWRRAGPVQRVDSGDLKSYSEDIKKKIILVPPVSNFNWPSIKSHKCAY